MKHASLAEEALDFLSGDRCWAEDQTGESDAPTGFVALLDLPDREAALAGLRSYTDATGPRPGEEFEAAVAEMVGAWIVTTVSTGAVYFESFLSWAEAERTFAEIVEQYHAWLDADDEDEVL